MSSPARAKGYDTPAHEHEVHELFKFKMRYGRSYVLVRWTGLDNLTNCKAIAAFEQATGRSLPCPPSPPLPLAGNAGTPSPIPPAAFTVDAAPPCDLGAALVGRTVLYWWPDDGWQRGTVARLCPRGTFSHVEAYSLTPGRRRRCVVRGTRCSTPPPTAPAGSRRPCSGCGPSLSTPGPPTPRVILVGGSSQLLRLATGRAAVTNGYSHEMFC